MKLTDFLIDLEAKASEQNIDIVGVVITEDQAKQLGGELPTRPPLPSPPAGSKELFFSGEIMGMKVYIRPRKLTPAENVAALLRRANATSFEMQDAFIALANYVESKG